MSPRYRIFFTFILAGLFFTQPGWTEDISILVGPRASAAYESAQAAEDGQTVFAERSIHRAFSRAADHLSTCGVCLVSVRISAGAYDGKAGVGLWVVPDVNAPEATLEITGGWNDSFDGRAPFDRPTILQSAETRSGPVLKFEGRKHAIGRLVISGLVFDSQPSNRYDSDSRALLKSSSSTWPLLSLGYLTTDHLVVADNVFMNGAAGVAGPSVRVLSERTRIDISNNIFFNNITPWIVAGGASEKMPAEIRLAHNSFVLNWPYNPDRTTSKPGALEIGNNYAAHSVVIERNLFAYNMGGAIFPQWDEDRGPPITIAENLFWQNGLMFGARESDTGAVVGKFAGAATHGIFSSFDLEDDFDWDVHDNQSFDPGFLITPPDLKAVQYGDAYRGADGQVDGMEAADARAESSDDLDDLAAQLAALTASASPGSADEDDNSKGGSDGGVELLGPDNDIRNYAPALAFPDVGLPFPTDPAAMAYGASPDRVWKGF